MNFRSQLGGWEVQGGAVTDVENPVSFRAVNVGLDGVNTERWQSQFVHIEIGCGETERATNPISQYYRTA